MRKIVYIQGMHCVSCEKLLDDEFSKLKGIKKVQVDRKKNIATIDYDEKFDFSEMESVAKKFGYIVSESEIKKSKRNWIDAIFIVVALLFFYKILTDSGILGKFSPDISQISLGVAFLIGLVASLSSCLAVVGSVVIAFSETFEAQGKGIFQKTIRPNLLFHAGRLGTFFILGGILGLIGKEITLSTNFIAVFTVIIAVVLFWLGLNILGVAPSITNVIKIPGFGGNKIKSLRESKNKNIPLILGALTFFLPCGFTQSMQIFALASGSFLTGSLSLFLFALGTTPVLLALGIGVSWTKSKHLAAFQRVAGILIIFFAIYTLGSGLTLGGIDIGFLGGSSQPSKIQEQKGAKVDDVQTVEMHVTQNGFEPNTFTIKKGIPVKFVVKGDYITGCTSKIIIPSLNITQALSKGDNVINFTPTEVGTIPFSCWMGMVRGKFIVE